jgi:hypothetical protein
VGSAQTLRRRVSRLLQVLAQRVITRRVGAELRSPSSPRHPVWMRGSAANHMDACSLHPDPIPSLPSE